MSFLTQKGRFLTFTSKLGPDKLIATTFEGTDAISAPFEYRFDLLSSDHNITSEKLSNTPVTLQINHGGKEPRYFHGIINSFEAGKIKNGKREYKAIAIPSIGFLKHATNYRIFKKKNSVEIFKILCAEYKITDFTDKSVLKVPPKREQCTQFGESTLDFIQRILAEDGIFFFFRHEKDKHTIVLGNEPNAHLPCPEPEIIYSTDNKRGIRHTITQWYRHYHFYSGKYVHCDYNHEDSSTSLHTTHENPAKLAKAKVYETYHYHGGHSNAARGKALATNRFEAEQAKHEVIHGSSNHACFIVGSHFKLSKHPEPTEIGEYVLLEVHHSAVDNSYLAGTPDAKKETQFYENSFSCIPKKVPYRPQIIQKPIMTYPQTAFVVSEDGKQKQGIDTDKYGRIHVQFHWQWRGNEKLKGEPSTIPVRVSQSWADDGYGTFFLPRIGQEVIVQFIDGDPDQPIVTGCVYNNNNPTPFSLPANQTQSGIKTRSMSSKACSGLSECNELRFEDKKGAEEIYVRAQKDFKRKIENDESVVIVKGNHEMKVEAGKSFLEAKESIEFKVGSNSIKITQDEVSINGKKFLVNES
jgi:type VI secretion system secreted protein VgrG